MYNVRIIVDESLLFFVHKNVSEVDFHVFSNTSRSIKDLLESIGIPHVEIGAVMVDGCPVTLNKVIGNDCSIDVYPCEQKLPGSFPPRFILDVHLGKLATNLRLLGFYADYSNTRDDAELEELALSGNYILLSCDRGLLMRRRLTEGMVIRSREPLRQAAEVLRRYSLGSYIRPLTRCNTCNGYLQNTGSLDKISVKDSSRIPERVRAWCNEYYTCSICGQFYWKGSHYDKLLEKIDKIMKQV